MYPFHQQLADFVLNKRLLSNPGYQPPQRYFRTPWLPEGATELVNARKLLTGRLIDERDCASTNEIVFRENLNVYKTLFGPNFDAGLTDLDKLHALSDVLMRPEYIKISWAGL